jgi:hypothetical protein
MIIDIVGLEINLSFVFLRETNLNLPYNFFLKKSFKCEISFISL